MLYRASIGRFKKSNHLYCKRIQDII
jgi:hypothetical protein